MKKKLLLKRAKLYRNLARLFLMPAFICVLLSMFASVPLFGCSIPVFKYALQAWQPGRYEIAVFYKKTLSESDNLLVKTLDAYETSGKANVTIRTVDITQKMDETTNSIWRSIKPAKLPVMAVFYPFIVFEGELSKNDEPAVWLSDLTEQNIKLVMDSPVRREIARQILNEVSIVWLLVESGDKKKDAAAEKTLKTEISILEKNIVLPEPNEFDYPYTDNSKIKFTLSVIKVSRRDVNEKFLVNSVLNSTKLISSKDIEKIKDPVVFPIFGQGRVFYPLIGVNISPDGIRETAEFIAGPCSCTVKEQNPGIDLLMNMKWESIIASAPVIEKKPPLKSISDFTDSVKKQEVTADAEAGQSRLDVNTGKSDNLFRNVIYLILGLAVAAFAWYIFHIVMSKKTPVVSPRGEFGINKRKTSHSKKSLRKRGKLRIKNK